MIVCLMYDKKSDSYDKPVFFENEVTAKRAFEMALNDKDSVFCKYLSDFEFYSVGELNLDYGTIVPCRDLICAGVNYCEDKANA